MPPPAATTQVPPAIPAPPAAIEPPPKAAKDALDSAAPLKEDIAVPPAVVPKTPVAPMLAAIAGAATPAVAIPTTVHV